MSEIVNKRRLMESVQALVKTRQIDIRDIAAVMMSFEAVINDVSDEPMALSLDTANAAARNNTPVATLYVNHFRGLENAAEFQQTAALPNGEYTLYTTPQRPAVPLTVGDLQSNAELMSLKDDCNMHLSTLMQFVEVIEHAHGIGKAEQ
jgi:hypothetical protein